MKKGMALPDDISNLPFNDGHLEFYIVDDAEA